MSEQLGLYVLWHGELLETSFFALEIFDKESILESGPFKITIDNDVINKSSYSFQGIKFSGISPSTSYSIALLSKNNPKRKIELEIYTKKKIKSKQGRLFNLYIFNIKSSWLIDFMNLLLVILGKTRVFWGKPYDPWR